MNYTLFLFTFLLISLLVYGIFIVYFTKYVTILKDG